MFDPYRKWLGILPKDQPPNHYRLLGVEAFEDDLDVIEGAADKQMAFVRQYQSGENAAAAARILNELAVARLCLLKASTKAAYDTNLRRELAARDPQAAPNVTQLTHAVDESAVSLFVEASTTRYGTAKRGGGWKLIVTSLVACAVLVASAFLINGRLNPPPMKNQPVAKQERNGKPTSIAPESNQLADAPTPRQHHESSND